MPSTRRRSSSAALARTTPQPQLLLGSQQRALVVPGGGGLGLAHSQRKVSSAGPSRRHQVSGYVVAVQNSIRLRDEYIQRLHEYVHQGGWRKLLGEIGDLIDLLRLQTVDVVARIRDWQQYIGKPKPFAYGVYPNYLLTIPHSLDFLADIPGFEDWLGFPAKRNPLLLPHGNAMLTTRLPHFGLVPIQSQALVDVSSEPARGDASLLKGGSYVYLNNVPPAGVNSVVRAVLTEERLYGVQKPSKSSLLAAQVATKVCGAFKGHRNLLARRISSSVKEFQKVMKLVGLKLLPNEWEWLCKCTQQKAVGAMPLGHINHSKVLKLMESDGTGSAVAAAGKRSTSSRQEAKSAISRGAGSSIQSRRAAADAVFAVTRSPVPKEASAQKLTAGPLPQFAVDQASTAHQVATRRKIRADNDVLRCRTRLEELQADLSAVQKQRQQLRSSTRDRGSQNANSQKKAVRFRQKQLQELVNDAQAMLDNSLKRRHDTTVALLEAGAALRMAKANLRATQEQTAAMTEIMRAQQEAAATQSLNAKGGLDRFRRSEAKRMRRAQALAAKQRREEELAEERRRWENAKLVKKRMVETRGRADEYVNDLRARQLLTNEDDQTIRKWTVKASYLLVDKDRPTSRELRQKSGTRAQSSTGPRRHSSRPQQLSVRRARIVCGVSCLIQVCYRHAHVDAGATDRQGQSKKSEKRGRGKMLQRRRSSASRTGDQRAEHSTQPSTATLPRRCADHELHVTLVLMENFCSEVSDGSSARGAAPLLKTGAVLTLAVKLREVLTDQEKEHPAMPHDGYDLAAVKEALQHVADHVTIFLPSGSTDATAVTLRLPSTTSSTEAFTSPLTPSTTTIAITDAPRATVDTGDTPHAKANSSQTRSGRLVAFRFLSSGQPDHEPKLNSIFVALTALRDSVGNCTIEAEQLCLPVSTTRTARLVPLEATSSKCVAAPTTVSEWNQAGLPRFVSRVSHSQLAKLGLASATPAAILRSCFFRLSARPSTVEGEAGSEVNELSCCRKWASCAFGAGATVGPESSPEFAPVENGAHGSTKLLPGLDERGTEQGGLCLLLQQSEGKKTTVSRRCVELRLKGNQGASAFRCSRLLPHRDDAAEDAAKNLPSSAQHGDVHVFLHARYNPVARTVIVSAETVMPFESMLSSGGSNDGGGGTAPPRRRSRVPFISVPLEAVFLSKARNLELLDLPEAQRELARAACDQVQVVLVPVGSAETGDNMRLELRRRAF